MAIPLGSVDWVAAMPRDSNPIFLKYPSTLRGSLHGTNSLPQVLGHSWANLTFSDTLSSCFKSSVWPCEWMGGWG